MKTDILIVGCGVGGLYTALNLPEDKKVTIITKSKAEESDSFLAQGGICVLHDDGDYDSFFEDTLRAGHYENRRESVDIMISGSRAVINDLIGYGVDFARVGGELDYTREGAHSRPRILFHKDETGKEITKNLLREAKNRKNITLYENFEMVDLIVENEEVFGIIGKFGGEYLSVTADYTVLATGGIGGLYDHSTNYPHLTADSLYLALKYGIKLENIDYIQIHPTSLYTERNERKFLISESVRGEGAILLNFKGERFIDELLPRDVVANAIYKEMEKEGSKHVWLSLRKIPAEEIKSHFPNIMKKCAEEGYDILKEPIPVVPSQHYFMGGIWVDSASKTSFLRLYAVGETSCNGVHGKNRLASNSLLESLVFASRAASDIAENYSESLYNKEISIDKSNYENRSLERKKAVLDAIEKEKQK